MNYCLVWENDPAPRSDITICKREKAGGRERERVRVSERYREREREKGFFLIKYGEAHHWLKSGVKPLALLQFGLTLAPASWLVKVCLVTTICVRFICDTYFVFLWFNVRERTGIVNNQRCTRIQLIEGLICRIALTLTRHLRAAAPVLCTHTHARTHANVYLYQFTYADIYILIYVPMYIFYQPLGIFPSLRRSDCSQRKLRPSQWWKNTSRLVKMRNLYLLQLQVHFDWNGAE